MRIRPDQFEQLQSESGQRLLATIRERNPAPAETLGLITELRRGWDADLVAAAMTMHALRQRAQSRFAAADRLWFTSDGLEQATSDVVAGYRVARFAGCDCVADLCCGIGGDLMALAQRDDVGPLVAVDRDFLHGAMADANVRVVAPQADLSVFVADAQSVDLAGVDGVFLDPARRQGGRRVGDDATSPPLEWALGLASQVARVGVTCAPGVPHERIPDGWELEMIAVESDLKEGMLWSQALATTSRRATVLDPNTGAARSLTAVPGNLVAIITPEAGMTIVDPSPAVTRAGLVQDFARVIDGRMIDERIAFLVTEAPVSTPFGRAMTIVDSMPWHERKVRSRLRELQAGPVDVRRRGLAGDVDAIAKRLRGKGDRSLTVLMTRHRDEPWAIIAEFGATR